MYATDENLEPCSAPIPHSHIGKYLRWEDKQDEICEDRQGAMEADARIEGTDNKKVEQMNENRDRLK